MSIITCVSNLFNEFFPGNFEISWYFHVKVDPSSSPFTMDMCTNITQLQKKYTAMLATISYHVLQKIGVFSDLDFAPTCMAAMDGLIAVGGQSGQLLVKQTGLNWTAFKSVGSTINNSIAISGGTDGQRIYVGNNDETIKVFSVPDLGTVATLPIGSAVNHIAISPDQQTMACVGDCNDVVMLDLRERDAFRMAGVLKMSDSGFGLGWSRNGMQLAAGSQDGTVSVWDVRSSKRMVKLESTQATPKGAVRSVKFSQTGSVDLLAFSEHTAFVNLVDARTFEDSCSIRVSPSLDVEVNISGMAFSPDSKSLMVGLEGGVLEYPIDVKSRMTFPLGSIL